MAQSTCRGRGQTNPEAVDRSVSIWCTISKCVYECLWACRDGGHFDRSQKMRRIHWGSCCIPRGTKNQSSACPSLRSATESPQWWPSPRSVSSNTPPAYSVSVDTGSAHAGVYFRKKLKCFFGKDFFIMKRVCVVVLPVIMHENVLMIIHVSFLQRPQSYVLYHLILFMDWVLWGNQQAQDFHPGDHGVCPVALFYL